MRSGRLELRPVAALGNWTPRGEAAARAHEAAERKATPVRTIAELSTDDLRVAGDTIETVIDLRAYLPTDRTLIMLAGRFRDDIREELGVPPLEPACRGLERKRLDDLSDEELDKLAKAVTALVGRFRVFIDDPELATQLGDLNARLCIRLYARATAEEARVS